MSRNTGLQVKKMHTGETRSQPFPSVLPLLATCPPQAVAAWVATDPVKIKSWALKDTASAPGG